jgi:hypothetical protein
MQLQSEKKLFAAGKYQIIPSTLAGLVEGKYGSEGRLSSETKFSPQTQELFGSLLIKKRLEQGGSDPIKQQYALSQEFAAIANPYTGSSYYDKLGNNKASITTQKMQTALMGGQQDLPKVAQASPSAAGGTGEQKQSEAVSGGGAAAPKAGTGEAAAASGDKSENPILALLSEEQKQMFPKMLSAFYGKGTTDSGTNKLEEFFGGNKIFESTTKSIESLIKPTIDSTKAAAVQKDGVVSGQALNTASSEIAAAMAKQEPIVISQPQVDSRKQDSISGRAPPPVAHGQNSKGVANAYDAELVNNMLMRNVV